MKRVILIILSATIMFCAGCQSKVEKVPAEASGTFFTDALGQGIEIFHPQRVAALIGSFADVWCLAGGQDTLVAAADDTWASFEVELGDDVVNLGAVKEPNLELLLAAEPDFIIASTNTEADLSLRDTFARAGIPTAYFDIQTLEDYLNMLQICTRLTGETENYERYGVEVAAQCQAAISRQDGSQPTVLTVRATGSSVKVKGSADFVLGEMLADLGCVNVADGNGALLEDLSLEAILAADPDYIFVVLQGADPTRARETLEETLLSNPAWQSLRAVREGRFYTLSHRLYNLKPNARWGEAYEGLADILYGA